MVLNQILLQRIISLVQKLPRIFRTKCKVVPPEAARRFTIHCTFSLASHPLIHKYLLGPNLQVNTFQSMLQWSYVLLIPFGNMFYVSRSTGLIKPASCVILHANKLLNFSCPCKCHVWICLTSFTELTLWESCAFWIYSLALCKCLLNTICDDKCTVAILDKWHGPWEILAF